MPPTRPKQKSAAGFIYLYKGVQSDTFQFSTNNYLTNPLIHITITTYLQKVRQTNVPPCPTPTTKEQSNMPTPPTSTTPTKTTGELLIEKYTAETEYAPPLSAVLSTVPPRKLKSDKQLLGVLQRVMMRGFQHDLAFPAIATMTCSTNFDFTTVTMKIITDEAGANQDVTVQLPQILTQLRAVNDPLPLYTTFAVDIINAIAKELQ